MKMLNNIKIWGRIQNDDSGFDLLLDGNETKDNLNRIVRESFNKGYNIFEVSMGKTQMWTSEMHPSIKQPWSFWNIYD